MAQHNVGRRDQVQPWFSARERSAAMMSAIVLIAMIGWHVAMVATTDVGLFDVVTTLKAALKGTPLQGMPGGPPSTGAAFTIFVVATVAGLAAFVALMIVTRRAFRQRSGGGRGHGKGLADRSHIEQSLGHERAREAAKRAMPSKKSWRKDDPSSFGFELGVDKRTRQPLLLGFEDSAAVLGPTGSRKSTTIMEPAALTAPGALIVTSNEVGILDTIAATRRAKGKVWVFDPLNRSWWPEPMVWDPVAGCEDGELAVARAMAFVAGCGADGQDSTNAGFFRYNSAMALRSFLHAAAIDTEPRTMADVLTWCARIAEGARTPRDIIDNSTDPRVERMWSAALESVATGAEETVASSRTTLAQVVDPMTLHAIQKWVIPRDEEVTNPDGTTTTRPVPVFDAQEFVRSSDTLVILSDFSSSTNVGPLCTMLLQEVVDAIKAYAPLTEHGRLEPPLRIVGDEIANIAPVEKLPELSTELRKNGVQLFLAFQSDQQAVTRWGAERGNTLWEQMAVEIVLPGLKSKTALERYSHLAGKVEVAEMSASFESGGERTGTSASLQERDVLRPDEIRRLELGRALLIYRNMPGIIADLKPWFERPGADRIQRDKKASAAARRAYQEQQTTKRRSAISTARGEGENA